MILDYILEQRGNCSKGDAEMNRVWDNNVVKDVNRPTSDISNVVMNEKVALLGKHLLSYLGVQGHVIYN